MGTSAIMSLQLRDAKRTKPLRTRDAQQIAEGGICRRKAAPPAKDLNIQKTRTREGGRGVRGDGARKQGRKPAANPAETPRETRAPTFEHTGVTTKRSVACVRREVAGMALRAIVQTERSVKNRRYVRVCRRNEA